MRYTFQKIQTEKSQLVILRQRGYKDHNLQTYDIMFSSWLQTNFSYESKKCGGHVHDKLGFFSHFDKGPIIGQ